MKLITFDAETYWSQTHSLTKMNPAVYVMHPETEVQSAAIKINDEDTFVLFGDELTQWIRDTDFSDTMLLGHNMSGFDAAILAWRFKVKPKAWACTLAMARHIGAAQQAGGSLKALAAHYGVGAKLDLEATNTKGKKLADFTDEEIEAMREYNKVDTDLCHALFKRMLPEVDTRALKLIDMTIRMMTEPKFVLDRPLLERTLVEIDRKKHDTLLAVGREISPMESGVEEDVLIELARATLSSAPKFAKLLESRGVPVPMKLNKKGKEIPALAKTDEGMQALVEHEDEDVAMLAEARLGVKSTQLETRIKSFLDVGAACRGRLPVFLNYAGAGKTLRWSGAFKLNQQNMPRIGKKPQLTDALRKSLRAPKGHKIVVADLSGIELRVMHFLWQVGYSTEMYRADPAETDLYVDFAAHKLYHKPESEVTKEERQIGKVAHLQLQFGSGASKFVFMTKTMGGVEITEEESQNIVDVYRASHPEIVHGWRVMTGALTAILHGTVGMELDPCGLCHTIEGGIESPRGRLYYPNLKCERNPETGYMEWTYDERSPKTRKVEPVKIYGAKLGQNLVQYLAREVMCDMMLDIQKIAPIIHTVHDEVILAVPESEAEDTLDEVQRIMRSGVSWFPDLVTWSDGSVADNYGEAKS